MGLDEVEQKVGKRSTYKFVLKYELQSVGGAAVSNYGKIQFSWKTDNAKPDSAMLEGQKSDSLRTDGGVLAYTVACNMERR